MRRIISISSVSLLLLTSFAWPQATKTPVSRRGPSVAVGSQGVVVSGRPAATAAGIKILEQGGNAADAGAATLLALSVTYVGAFCVGGEVPILVYSADQKNVKLLEGQGEAPRDPKAIAWYMEHGIPDGDVKAAAVPSTIDAIVTLLKVFGTKSFEEVVQPTLAILDAGGPSWYIDTGSGTRIETGVNWQADMAVTFRKLVESEKLAKGTRQQKIASRVGPLLSRRHRRRTGSLVYRKGWFPSQGGFGRAQNPRGGSARNHLPRLHGV
jgi:gamma-glutamyltranspeptidase / glutathione hydrolase